MRYRNAIIACLYLLFAQMPIVAQPPQQQKARPPIDWIFLIDTSRTMLGQGKAKGKNIFSDVKQTILDFLSRQVRVGDSVQVIPFDVASRPSAPTYIASESDKQYVRKTVTPLPAEGQYTYIAEAIQNAREVIAERNQSKPTGPVRKYAVIIFTDGIDEPPPGTSQRIDLRQTLVGFPTEDTLFYFVNLGDTSDTNSLFNAMSGNDRLKANVRNHPKAEELGGLVDDIAPEIEKPAAIELFIVPTGQFRQSLVVEEAATELRPFEVRATGAGHAKLEFIVPAGLSVELKDAPFFAIGREPVAPTLKVLASERLNDTEVQVRARLLPTGDTMVLGEAKEATISLRFHRPTALERVLPWVVSLVVLAALAALGMLAYQKWNTVNIEGLLYIQEPGRSQPSDPFDLRSYRKPQVTLGGAGAQILPNETKFRFRLRAEGSGGRVRQVVLVRETGAVTVNGLEHISRVCNEDEIDVGGYKIRYENFKLPPRQE